MSPPLLSTGEEGQSNVTLLASPSSMESICQNGSQLKERNYMGLSDCSSVDSSTISTSSEDNNVSLNLKATELRLGLPGSQSPDMIPERNLLSSAKLNEKPLFPLHPLKDGNLSMSHKASGSKRGFSDAMDGFSEGQYLVNKEVNVMLSPRPASNFGVKSSAVKENPMAQPAKMKELIPQNPVQDRPRAANEASLNRSGAANNSSSTPAAKL